MGKAKRAHQFHEAGQRQSFEDGRRSCLVGDRIEFCPQDAKTRENDREKKSVPSESGRAHQFHGWTQV